MLRSYLEGREFSARTDRNASRWNWSMTDASEKTDGLATYTSKNSESEEELSGFFKGGGSKTSRTTEYISEAFDGKD